LRKSFRKILTDDAKKREFVGFFCGKFVAVGELGKIFPWGLLGGGVGGNVIKLDFYDSSVGHGSPTLQEIRIL